MVAGFFVQQATKIQFIEKCIAGTAAEAKTAFDGLLAKSATQGRDLGFGGGLDGRPFISRDDAGFLGLARLYSRTVARGLKPGQQMGTIDRFTDACATVPDSRRGSANLVVVSWAHGAMSQTSYEDIREMISKETDASLRPWQYSLFFIGLLVNVGTFKLTYFPKPAPNVVDAEAKKDETGSEKTQDSEPSKKE